MGGPTYHRRWRCMGNAWTTRGGQRHVRTGGAESEGRGGVTPGGTWSRGSSRVPRGGGWRQERAVGAAEVPLPRERQVGQVLALHGLDAPGLRVLRRGAGGPGGAEGRAVGRAGAGGRTLSGPGHPLLAVGCRGSGAEGLGGGRGGQGGLRGAGGQTQKLGQHQVLLPQQPALVVCSVALSFGNELKKLYWKETHNDQVLEHLPLGSHAANFWKALSRCPRASSFPCLHPSCRVQPGPKATRGPSEGVATGQALRPDSPGRREPIDGAAWTSTEEAWVVQPRAGGPWGVSTLEQRGVLTGLVNGAWP